MCHYIHETPVHFARYATTSQLLYAPPTRFARVCDRLRAIVLRHTISSDIHLSPTCSLHSPRLTHDMHNRLPHVTLEAAQGKWIYIFVYIKVLSAGDVFYSLLRIKNNLHIAIAIGSVN